MNKRLLMIIAAFAISTNTHAGVYTDDLSRCLVESSTPSDKTTLVKWMFTSMALHPEVKHMSNVTPKQRDMANKAVADLFMKLMTDACVVQSKKAIQYEGQIAIQQGFTILGQVAGKELFANPNVAEALSGLGKHIDGEKLASALGINK